MTPLRLSPAFESWDRILGLIDAAFAVMEMRIDPPSSVSRLTPDGLRSLAQRSEVWALFEGETPVARVVLDSRDGALWLGKLAVRPDRQRRGLGRQMVVLAADRARALGLAQLALQTRIELAETHAAFAALGFRKTGETCHDGYDRRTSLTMQKTLASL